MFGKGKDELEDVAMTVPRPHATDQPNSVLGQNSRFVGDVKVEGTIRIDGEVQGNVEAGERVQLGESGVVRGGIVAREVVISGKLAGKLQASDLVRLLKGGKIEGDVATRRLVVEDGAVFDGSCAMEQAGSQRKGDATGRKVEGTVAAESLGLEVVKPRRT
jgi:cytoskeletal protein CcmA (bactofilin family)